MPSRRPYRSADAAALGGVPVVGSVSTPKDSDSCELWIRRGSGVWRCESEGQRATLIAQAHRLIETLEKRHTIGEALVAKVGAHPVSSESGTWRTRGSRRPT